MTIQPDDEDTVDYSETTPTLDDWLYQWEAAVEAGQSMITRDEAIRRYYERYPEAKR